MPFGLLMCGPGTLKRGARTYRCGLVVCVAAGWGLLRAPAHRLCTASAAAPAAYTPHGLIKGQGLGCLLARNLYVHCAQGGCPLCLRKPNPRRARPHTHRCLLQH